MESRCPLGTRVPGDLLDDGFETCHLWGPALNALWTSLGLGCLAVYQLGVVVAVGACPKPIKTVVLRKSTSQRLMLASAVTMVTMFLHVAVLKLTSRQRSIGTDPLTTALFAMGGLCFGFVALTFVWNWMTVLAGMTRFSRTARPRFGRAFAAAVAINAIANAAPITILFTRDALQVRCSAKLWKQPL